ncbi:MAG TPA: chemotaxis protein CheD [Rectinemataceae bacterium]|nr:chemotaxis protein CheD [Rectinemataceae bacterium]
MATITLGVGDWAVSDNAADVIKTYALGSCVAVMIFDVSKTIAGMAHVALPDSAVDPEKAKAQPGYFADVGVAVMIEEMKRRGATRPHVWVKLAGGAAVMDPKGIFDIGKRNVLAIKRALWRSALGPIGEDTGGSTSRTVAMNVADGAITLSAGPRQWTI